MNPYNLSNNNSKIDCNSISNSSNSDCNIISNIDSNLDSVLYHDSPPKHCQTFSPVSPIKY